jgi:hypothetical protein
MASKSELVTQGRKAIDAVAKRVKEDPDYAARFKEEPAELLLEAGAPQEGLVDVLRETGFDEDDVSGFLFKIAPDIKLPSTRTGLSTTSPSLPGGGLAGDCETSCSGTCNCSSSCLFTF